MLLEVADEAFVLDVDPPLPPPDEFGLEDFEVFLLLAIGVVIAATVIVLPYGIYKCCKIMTSSYYVRTFGPYYMALGTFGFF